MSKLRRQISYNASLSYMIVTSVCSNSECTQSTVLYGSTTNCVVDHEALQTSAVISKLADAIQDKIHDL